MSWKATAYVKSLKLAPNGKPVKRNEKLFLFVLADSHNEDRKGAWPSMAKLARAALLSVRRMREIAKQCKHKGLICWDQRILEHGGNAPSMFHFCAIDCAHEPLLYVPKNDDEAGPEDETKTSGGGEISSPPPDEEISPGVVKKQHGGDGEILAPGGCEPSQGDGASRRRGMVRDAAPPPITQPSGEPSGEPSHTPTCARAHTRERHPAAQAQASLPGVCVGSRFNQKLCEEWALSRSRLPGSKIVDPYAVAFARYCDGKADEAIAKWLEDQSPEKIAEARNNADTPTLSFHYAAGLVQGMVSHGTDAQAAINSLDNLSDDVRARLVEKFVKAEAR
jgi:hypothetical protein